MSFWLLALRSRDLSQAEEEITACKAEQVKKMTTNLTQNDNLGSFWVKIVVILWIFSAYETFFFFLSLR